MYIVGLNKDSTIIDSLAVIFPPPPLTLKLKKKSSKLTNEKILALECVWIFSIIIDNIVVIFKLLEYLDFKIQILESWT